MPTLSRLEQLRRQRALLQEHLAWLDREIAGEMVSGQPPGTPEPKPVSGSSGYRPPLPLGTSAASAASSASATATTAISPGSGPSVNVEELFNQIRADHSKENTPPSKTGCWIAFAVILLVLIGAAGAAIIFLYR